MTRVKQAEFARLMGVNRSTVTRWKEDGRLVIDGGLVNVEESQRRIEETSGGRDDMAARHAANRGAVIPAHQPTIENRSEDDSRERATPPQRDIETRSYAQARKESLTADILEMEIEQKRGNLFPKDVVFEALRIVSAAIRSAMDVFADQTAPLVTPVTSYDENHAILSEAARNVQAIVADQIHRQELAISKGE